MNKEISTDEFTESIESLEGVVYLSTRAFRHAEIEHITTQYIDNNGKTPAPHLLDRLANVFLHEELSDPHPDRMSRIITPEMTLDERRLHEYPIMSERMYNARTRGSGRSKTKAGVQNVEVAFGQADNIGADGKDYGVPQRNFSNRE